MKTSRRDTTTNTAGSNKVLTVPADSQAILNAIPDLIFRISRDGTYLDFKQAAAIPLLLDPEKFLGKNIFDVVPEHIARVTMESIERTARSHEPVTFHYQLEINGDTYSYEARIVESGLKDEFLAIVRDVTVQDDILRKLEENETKYRALFENANDSIILMSKDQFIDCNSKTLEIFGCKREEIIGNTPMAFSPAQQPDGRDSDEKAQEKIVATLAGNPQRFEWLHRKLDGTSFETEVSLNRITLNEQTLLQAIIRDITDRKTRDAQVSKLSSVMEQTADIIVVTDTEGIIEYVNPSFERITGYTYNEAVNNSPGLVASGLHKSEFYRHMWETITAGESYSNIFINRRKNGSLYYEEKTITPIKDQSGTITHYVATGKDISERIQIQERLQHMAHHDALTDLPNRNLFLDRLQQALNRARWHNRLVAVMFMDLDRFKNINDTLGHNVGDQLLLELSRRLGGTVRDGDTIARFGGDEFAILLDDIDSDSHISSLAQKLLDTLSMPFKINKQELFVTASIGVSIFPNDGDDSDTLLRNADVAMYRAKDMGKNNYQFYSDDLSARIFERLTLENHLRHALERNEFVLYYQPQVDARTNKISGVEALLRWQHPEIGLVTPNNIIPLLEETGLIEKVGHWVLETACRQSRAWHDTGWPFIHMSVNISSRQFNNTNFISSVHDIINQAEINPEFLELELTESMLMRNASSTVNALHSLSGRGVRFAIDDFGTGYSSLTYLRRFPIDTIKIDRSFIHDVTDNPDDAAIASAIIVMAQSLSLNVIAEGVENQKQLDFLTSRNCHYLQGNFFSRPLPAEELTRLLEDQNK